MINPDLINASYEVGGTMAMVLNIRQILKDKQVKGVSIYPTIFFTTWGIWNLFWYWYLWQPISWTCAGGMVLTNLIWLYFYRKYKNDGYINR